MAGASNLLMMYLAVELSSITSYILAGYTKEAPDSSEASLKYVIYGALSSGLMLYGISLIYGLTGSLDFYAINKELPGVLAEGGSARLVLLIAGILMLAGLGYKISAVPFHFWAPDVYEGAPGDDHRTSGGRLESGRIRAADTVFQGHLYRHLRGVPPGRDVVDSGGF